MAENLCFDKVKGVAGIHAVGGEFSRIYSKKMQKLQLLFNRPGDGLQL